MVTEPLIPSMPAGRRAHGRLRFGPFRLDRRSGFLVRGDEEIRLPPRALAVLERLLERAGEVVPKDELIRAGWQGVHVGDSSLAEAVGLIRQALGDDSQSPRYVQTVHRRGYRFVAPVTLEGPTGADPESGGRAPRPVGRGLDGRSAAAAGPRHARRSALLALGGVALVALAAALVWWLTGPFPPGPTSGGGDGHGPVRVRIRPPEDLRLMGRGSVVAFSPDGGSVVFAAREGDHRRLYRRRLASFEAEPLPGTEEGYSPFFSPDGRWLAFFDGRELKKLSLAADGTGAEGVQTVADAPKAVAGVWGRDGRILFADLFRSLKVVDAGGGEVARLAVPDPAARERALTGVELLPDGRRALVTVWRSTVEASSVDLLDLTTGTRRTVISGAIHARLRSSGPAGRAGSASIHYVTADGLMVAPFDPATATLEGPPELTSDRVAVDHLSGLAQYDLSDAGDLVFAPAPAVSEERTLQRIRAVGEGRAFVEELPTASRYYRNLTLSPDRSRFVVTALDPPRSDLWLGETASGALRRLTFDAFDIEPVWAPDGGSVTFASDRSGSLAIFRLTLAGDGGIERLTAGEQSRAPQAWSPDGRWLAFVEIDPDTGADLWLFDADTGETEPFLVTAADEYEAEFSPDGRWISYSSDRSGRREVYVRSLEGRGPWQISTDGGWGAE